MKRPEEYRLKEHFLLMDPHDQETYNRLLGDLKLSEELEKALKRYPGPAYDHWADRSPIPRSERINKHRGIVGYETQTGLDILDYILRNAKEKNDFNFLDAGCGMGYCAEEVALIARVLQIPCSVYACDTAPPSPLPKVITKWQSIADMEDRNFFDLIAASFVLPHLIDPLKAIENLYMTLRPGGLFVATVFPKSITINGHLLDSKEAGFLERIAASRGSAVFKPLPNNPNQASAIHLTRGELPLERHAFQSISHKPEQGWPIQVEYTK